VRSEAWLQVTLDPSQQARSQFLSRMQRHRREAPSAPDAQMRAFLAELDAAQRFQEPP
jgi:hypothetical protein